MARLPPDRGRKLAQRPRDGRDDTRPLRHRRGPACLARRIALVGRAYAVGLAFATVALTWHYPSDLFGGFLVAGLWVALVLAVLARLEPEPERLPRLDWLIAAGAGGALVAAALVGMALSASRSTLLIA